MTNPHHAQQRKILKQRLEKFLQNRNTGKCWNENPATIIVATSAGARKNRKRKYKTLKKSNRKLNRTIKLR